VEEGMEKRREGIIGEVYASQLQDLNLVECGGRHRERERENIRWRR